MYGNNDHLIVQHVYQHTQEIHAQARPRALNAVNPVLFDGIIRVSDPDFFFDELKKGIGPAKAFGCGLLSIAPA